jgi:hypothetical protein
MRKSTAIKKWCDNLSLKIAGKATLSNMYYDVVNERIDKSQLSLFMNNVLREWSIVISSSIDAFENARISMLKIASQLGPPVPENSRNCSRVMSYKDFFAHNIHQSVIPFAIREFASVDQIKTLERFGIKGATKGKMETRRPFSWVTQTSAMEKIRKKWNTAFIVRQYLGLLHFQEDEDLIEIIFPPAISKCSKVTQPTFVEGSPTLIYRSKIASDGWGRAVDLQTYKEGYPEAIHESVNFTDEFEFKYLGRLTPFTQGFDWKKHYELFEFKWDQNYWRTLANHVK